MLAKLSLQRWALAAPAERRSGDAYGCLVAKPGANGIAGARKQELGKRIAATASPRRRPSSFALDEDDLDDDTPPPRSSSDYALLLSEAERQGDWVKAVELITEARVLRVRLPAEGFEAAARVAADTGDWQQAATFLARAARAVSSDERGSPTLPPPPACSAIREVFSRLAREVQAEAIMDLLDLLREGEVGSDDASSPSPSPSPSSWSQRPAETRSHALNCAARACARASSGGKTKMMLAKDSDDRNEEAAQQLSEEDRSIFFEASLSLLDDVRDAKLQIEDGTFGSVALAALAMGKPELSEELLEERDYL